MHMLLRICCSEYSLRRKCFHIKRNSFCLKRTTYNSPTIDVRGLYPAHHTILLATAANLSLNIQHNNTGASKIH